MKVCSNCKVEKELIEFTEKKNRCKICTSIYLKNYRELNKKILKEKASIRYLKYDKEKTIKYHKNYHKKYYENNKEIYKKKAEKYKENNKEKSIEYSKNYYINNKEKIIIKQKNYVLKNKEKRIECVKKYKENNKEILKEKAKIYYQKNKHKKNEYVKNYRLNNPLFDLSIRIRQNIRSTFKVKNYDKKSKTTNILGCSIQDFKNHLERQFTKGMTWENAREWHLDHIYPVSLAKDEEELIRLNHYTNFQPLWAKDNLQKGNKIINNKQLKLI